MYTSRTDKDCHFHCTGSGTGFCWRWLDNGALQLVQSPLACKARRDARSSAAAA